jgi:hypothetical protein
MTPGNRRLRSKLGIYVYGAAGIALGVSGLVWKELLKPTEGRPHGEALAYHRRLWASGSTAISWRRTAQAGACMLAMLYSIFTLLWCLRSSETPNVYDVWRNFRRILLGNRELDSLSMAGAR